MAFTSIEVELIAANALAALLLIKSTADAVFSQKMPEYPELH